jgi:APA family basic amino acid/polyamine antiporter
MGRATNHQMGIWMTTALVVGTMIGSGIFMLPVTLAPLGVNVVLGWVTSSVGALCIAISLARLSQLGGDGIQSNVERELGKTPAFLVAWAFWVSNWAAQAAVALAGASAVSWIDPHFSGPGFVIPVAIGSVVLFTAINMLGARAAGRMLVLTVAVKLLPLVAVILIVAMRRASGIPYEPFAPAPLTLANFATAVALTFFALTGFENVTAPVDKVRDPGRNIPIAIVGGTLFVAIIYLLSSTGVQMLLPAQIVAVSAAPFADAIAAQWGGAVASLAALAISVAAFGCLNGLILGTGELGYAMGLRGDLPAIMTLTRGNNTPVGAQLAGSVLTILLILANSNRASASLFTFIILLSTAAVLVVYLAGALTAWRLGASPAARTPSIVAMMFILFALYGAGAEADFWCFALLAIGLIVRTTMRRIDPRPIGSPLAAAPVASSD